MRHYIMKWTFLLAFSFFSIVNAEVITPDLEYQKISGVGYSWQMVNLSNNYTDAIVVCTNVLPDNNHNEAVVRVRNIGTNSFQIKIQRPDDRDPGYATDVYCVISDEGSYTVPMKYEAHHVNSATTSRKGSWNTNTLSVSLTNSYTDPTVLGQVMSYNDSKFSVFWSHRCGTNSSRRKTPYTGSGNLCVEKHISKTNGSRNNETLGYIVVESGEYAYNNVAMKVALGSDKIKGVDNTPPLYRYSLGGYYSHAVATQEAEDGGDGGWAVMYGSSPLSGGYLSLAIDEGVSSGSNNRTHTAEQVGYWAFGIEAITNPAKMIINEILFYEQDSSTANEEFVEFYVTQSGTLKNMMVTDQESGGGRIHTYWFEDHQVNQGDYVLLYTGSGTDHVSVDGKVHYFYMSSKTIWNNDNDDVLLLAPSSTDTTTINGVVYHAVPSDYVSYSRSGTGNIDGVPPTTSSNTISFTGNVNASGISRLQSISLTPNGQDTNQASDWEKTTSDDASGLITIDTNTGSAGGYDFVCSDGKNNNAMPDMSITKSSIVISDPVNNTNNPKRIPGAIIRYCFTVKNTGEGSADNVVIHDTLDGGNKDKLSYVKSGKADIVPNINDCTESECAGIADASGSYVTGTKKVDIDLATPFPKDNHQCAYIETEIN